MLEIKAKQIENNKKSGSGSTFTAEELHGITQQILINQEKMKKKNPYKYSNMMCNDR